MVQKHSRLNTHSNQMETYQAGYELRKYEGRMAHDILATVQAMLMVECDSHDVRQRLGLLEAKLIEVINAESKEDE